MLSKKASKWSAVFAAVVSAIVTAGVARAAAPTVFDSLPAPTIPVIREGVPLAGGPLRMLTIAERVGVARTNELVRVPLFFHPGECSDPDGLVIYDLADASKTAIPYQADDIRKAESGEVARMHVYFYADMKPWEHKQFGVMKGKNPGAALPPVSMTESGENVVFKGDDITVGFIAKGPKAGAITQLETSFGKLNLMDGFIAPEVRLVRQDSKCKEIHRNEIGYDKPAGFEVREIKFAAGPLFGKLRVKIGPVGVPDSAETTFLIPKTGSLMVITQRTFPEDPEGGDVVGSAWPELLKGRVTFGEAKEPGVSTKISTGLRKIIREAQNQKVEAVVAEKSGFSIINIPPVSNGGEIHYQATDPQPERLDEKGKTKKAEPPKFSMSYMGPGSLNRGGGSNSGTLRAFWIQSRMVFAPTTDVEKLWDDVRVGQNSLVAVVDEPGIKIDDLAAAFADCGKLFWAIKNWPHAWQQTAAMDYLVGKDDAMKDIVAAQAKTPKVDAKHGDQAKVET